MKNVGNKIEREMENKIEKLVLKKKRKKRWEE